MKLIFLAIYIVLVTATADSNATQTSIPYRSDNRSNGQVRAVIPPNSCEITAQQLQDLIDMMNDLSGKKIKHYKSFSRTETRASSCPELIAEMQQSVKDITDAYEEMLDTNISPAEYEALKREYEQKIIDLNKQFDDLAQAAKQESQREIEKLQNELHDLNVALEKALKELEDERAAHRETKTKLVIANIQANQITAALTTYNALQETALMTRIITDAYLSIYTYSNCQTFTERTYNYEAWSLGYTALYNRMESNRDIQTQQTIEFAYIIKEILDSYYGEYRYRFDNLKWRFSTSVRYTIWSYTVCMKNTEYNEYIYSPNNYFDFDKERARVFTWIPGYIVVESDMQFLPKNRGEYFYLKNTYRNRYMYSPNNYFNYDRDRREVFFWKSGSAVSNGDWIVKIDSYDTIRLYSRTNNQYFYAASSGFNYDRERRRVFTWIPGNNVNQAPFKLVQC